MDTNLSTILARLQSQDRQEQLAVMDELLTTKNREAVSDVIGVLQSPYAVVRARVAEYLGQYAPLGDEQAGTALLPLLNDSDEFVRMQVVESLGLLTYKPAIAHLQSLALNDREELMRVEAVDALARFLDEDLFATFEHALNNDKAALVQRFAARAIMITAQSSYLDAIKRDAKATQDEAFIAIHLFLAAYKMGVTEYLEQILFYLKTADDLDELGYLLHVLRCAYTGQLPQHVIIDIPQIIVAFDALAQRIPDAESACSELKDQLAAIKEGKIISFKSCC